MALFDSLLRKVDYTKNAVNAIGNAANAKGAGIDMGIDPLASWADKILAIPSAGVILIPTLAKSQNVNLNIPAHGAIDVMLTKEE